LPETITNRHLEYALTWYGLAAALVGVYIALVRRKLKSA
jgi:surfeit locus 1 family protein